MEKKEKSKKTFVTLDELMNETLGKKGTPKRDKFDKQSRKETKNDLRKVIDGKETLMDIDVITNKDLQGYSYEEMLNKIYGKKGTPTRIAAEKRIKEKAKTLLSDINKKEVKEAKKNEMLFLEFAKEFSKKASRVSAGDKFPSIYINNSSGKFRVDYYLKIRDRKTGKIVPTSARINLVTGIIEVSKTAFLKYTIPKRIKILLSLYAKWVNKNELNKDGKPTKSIKSTAVLAKRKPKKAINNKIRKGKKNPVGQKNNKKRKGIK